MRKEANFSILLNDKIVKNFARLSGDKNKIHLSKNLLIKTNSNDL